MAASRLAGIVDPTKPGEYPIVLSDALLGKSSSKEAFTGITYNHKPTALSSESSNSTARIRSSTNGVVDLSHETANDGTYGFTGARSSKDGEYVLVFDPTRRVFVLHRLDSMFHMNLTLTPDNDDAAALKEEYPQLDPPKGGMGKAGAVGSAKGKDKPTTAARAAAAKNKSGISSVSKSLTPAAKKKAEKKAAPPPAVPLPTAAPTPPLPSQPKAAAEPAKDTKAKKPTRRKLSDDESDDDDDDGGLVLEFPEGSAPAASRAPRARDDFSPAFPIRRFSEFARGEEDEEEEEDYGRTGGAGAENEEDADGEDDEEYEDMLDMDEPDHLKLPSPLNGSGGQQVGLGIGSVLAGGVGDDEMDEDDELEAELEKQLMEEDEEMNGEESDVSEEE